MNQPTPTPATKQLFAIYRKARDRQPAINQTNSQLWETCQQLQLLLHNRARMEEAMQVPELLRKALGLLEDLAPGWDLGRPLAPEFYRLIDPACKVSQSKLERSYRTALHSLLLACMVLHVHFGQACLAIRNGASYLLSDHAKAFRATFQIAGEV